MGVCVECEAREQVPCKGETCSLKTGSCGSLQPVGKKGKRFRWEAAARGNSFPGCTDSFLWEMLSCGHRALLQINCSGQR